MKKTALIGHALPSTSGGELRPAAELIPLQQQVAERLAADYDTGYDECSRRPWRCLQD